MAGNHQEPDTLVLDLTTWKSVSKTNSNFVHGNDSSTQPVFITYDIVEKNKENWNYRVRSDSENKSTSAASSPGTNSTKLTLLSKANQQNYSATGEQTFRPANGFHEAEQFEKASAADRNSFHIVTYVLAGLGVIPLVIGIAIAIKMIAYPEKKKQVGFSS